MKTIKHLVLFTVFATFLSCSNAQQPKSVEGQEIKPGAKELQTGFFSPFNVDGVINEVDKKGKTSVFRIVNKTMENTEFNGSPAIKQKLHYYDANEIPTGVHITIYDPKTLQVLFWQYKNKSNNTAFAFKQEGTFIKGTEDLNAPDDKWQGMDIGTKVFQNESRELLFRAMDVPIGTVVKFPVIGMQPPFHGWVNYKYAKNKKATYKGKSYDAKIWESANDPDTFYTVIEEAPYVIHREVNAGKGVKHIFTFGK